ncbi:helix-turn-helix domain-containing protein [Flammeovirga aprica]|uniref:Helix-turn-helix transcriptional regulator n=1 Tax=Flammeovirga aprica JL-4 TaxID=694437 RepID=A0A7X9RV82_9BACT|nr:AraC family transcriptional regulator [Flammeovirga aprica]NME69323.1 helix-turn-helix transcriptional regulator [Flammeovirga aprica JL-4]
MSRYEFDYYLDLWSLAFKSERRGDVIILDKTVGEGEVRGYKCSDTIEIFKFNFILKEPLHIHRDEITIPMEYQPIFFGEPVEDNVVKEVTYENGEAITQDYSFNSNGALCTNTEREISWTYPKGKRLRFVSVRLKKDYFNELVNRSETLQSLFRKDDTFYIFEEFDPQMKLLFHRIYEVKKEDIFEQELTQVFASNLVLHYFENINKRESMIETNKYPFNIEPVMKARQILLNILDRPVNIDFLTRECGLSESRLRFLFKKVFGTTIHQYHQDVRLTRSRDFLHEGKLSMSMIAMELGFSSSSHFSMVFKKKFKVTPKDYKQDRYLWDH